MDWRMRRLAVVMMVAMLWTRGVVAEEATPGETAAKPPATVAGEGESRALLTSGRELLSKGKIPEAVAILEKARLLEPKSNEAGFLLSAAYIEQGRFEDALPMLESLQKAMPDNPMIKNNLAWVYVKIKDPAIKNPAKAVKLARSAVIDAPSDYLIWNTLSEAYYAEGRYDRALRAAQSALRLSVLAGVTNTVAGKDLVARCRRAAGETASKAADED
jgi:tetratricopeptide (TPR) repeat protein